MEKFIKQTVGIFLLVLGMHMHCKAQCNAGSISDWIWTGNGSTGWEEAVISPQNVDATMVSLSGNNLSVNVDFNMEWGVWPTDVQYQVIVNYIGDNNPSAWQNLTIGETTTDHTFIINNSEFGTSVSPDKITVSFRMSVDHQSTWPDDNYSSAACFWNECISQDNGTCYENGIQGEFNGSNCDCIVDAIDNNDYDDDGILDADDNCPTKWNQNQADSDNDGIGDACDDGIDADSDGDGIVDSEDPCPSDPHNNCNGNACVIGDPCSIDDDCIADEGFELNGEVDENGHCICVQVRPIHNETVESGDHETYILGDLLNNSIDILNSKVFGDGSVFHLRQLGDSEMKIRQDGQTNNLINNRSDGFSYKANGDPTPNFINSCSETTIEVYEPECNDNPITDNEFYENYPCNQFVDILNPTDCNLSYSPIHPDCVVSNNSNTNPDHQIRVMPANWNGAEHFETTLYPNTTNYVGLESVDGPDFRHEYLKGATNAFGFSHSNGTIENINLVLYSKGKVIINLENIGTVVNCNWVIYADEIELRMRNSPVDSYDTFNSSGDGPVNFDNSSIHFRTTTIVSQIKILGDMFLYNGAQITLDANSDAGAESSDLSIILDGKILVGKSALGGNGAPPNWNNPWTNPYTLTNYDNPFGISVRDGQHATMFNHYNDPFDSALFSIKCHNGTVRFEDQAKIRRQARGSVYIVSKTINFSNNPINATYFPFYSSGTFIENELLSPELFGSVDNNKSELFIKATEYLKGGASHDSSGNQFDFARLIFEVGSAFVPGAFGALFNFGSAFMRSQGSVDNSNATSVIGGFDFYDSSEVDERDKNAKAVESQFKKDIATAGTTIMKKGGEILYDPIVNEINESAGVSNSALVDHNFENGSMANPWDQFSRQCHSSFPIIQNLTLVNLDYNEYNRAEFGNQYFSYKNSSYTMPNNRDHRLLYKFIREKTSLRYKIVNYTNDNQRRKELVLSFLEPLVINSIYGIPTNGGSDSYTPSICRNVLLNDTEGNCDGVTSALQEIENDTETRNLTIAKEKLPVFKEAELHIFPNPSTGYITLQSSEDELNHTIRIFDVTGSSLVKTVDGSKTNEMKLDLSGLPNGLYLVKTKTLSSKVILTK